MGYTVEDLLNKVPAAERAPFWNKVQEVAAKLKVPAYHLLAIMDLESGIRPDIQNSLGYTGLIQFGNAAAADLGTTTSALKRMTRVQQMDYVLRYYQLWMRRLGISSIDGFIDMYLIVFYPNGVKEKNYDVPFASPKVESANPVLRDPATGKITKRSIMNVYADRYEGLFDKTLRVAKDRWWIFVIIIVIMIVVLIKAMNSK